MSTKETDRRKGPEKAIPLIWLRGMPDISWHDRAACDKTNSPDADPRDFDEVRSRTGKGAPDKQPTVKRAKLVCARCPVVQPCRVQAARDPHSQGVWGGLYWNDHRRKGLRAYVLSEEIA